MAKTHTRRWDRPGTHGTTFGGSPLACALGYHVLSRLSDKAFVANIRETSEYLRVLRFMAEVELHVQLQCLERAGGKQVPAIN